MNRKSAWTMLGVLGLVSLMLACSSTSTAIPVAKEAVTIRWRTRPGDQAEQDVYQTISDELNQKLAAQGIKLEYDPAPTDGYFDKLTAEFSAGTAPDIVWVGAANMADYTAQGNVLDLKPLADADILFNLDDYYEAPMAELERDGKLWGLPRDVSPLVMYYNKDLFEAAGLEDPEALAAKGQWTWEAFRQAAIALTDPAKEQYGFSMSSWWGTWGWFVLAGGGNLFNPDRTACNLTDPGSIAGLQFMADLFLKDKVAPPSGVQGGGEPEFHAGKLAMLPNGRWMTPSVRQDQFDWGVVPMPRGPAGRKTWLFWGPYLVNARTTHPQQAWIVLKELTSPDVQARIAALGAIVPSNKDAVAVNAFLKSKPPTNNSPFIKGANYAQAETALFTGSWTAVNAAYQAAIDQIFAGKATPEEAVQQACHAANPLIKQ